jgi:hypothetical protein
MATTTTTLTAIRANYSRVLQALVPSLVGDRRFHTSAMRQWYDGERNSSSLAPRLFLWDSDVEAEELGVIDPAAMFVRQSLILRVCYPRIPTLYQSSVSEGNGDDAIEAVVSADADQLHDALFSSDNYLTGQSACFPGLSLNRDWGQSPDAWLLTVNCVIDYYRARSL